MLRLPEEAPKVKVPAAEYTNALVRATRRIAGLNDDLNAIGFQNIADSNPHGTVLLRSNEQQVPVGGSTALPKHSLAALVSADTNALTAVIGLGTMHKIEKGDQFRILTGSIGVFWILTITNADRAFSAGTLKTSSPRGYAVDSTVLRPGTAATLINAYDIWR